MTCTLIAPIRVLVWQQACHSKKWGTEGYGHGGATRANYVDRFSPSPYTSPATSIKPAWSPRATGDGQRSRSASPDKASSTSITRNYDSPLSSSSNVIAMSTTTLDDDDDWLPPSQRLPPAAAYAMGPASPPANRPSSWHMAAPSPNVRSDSPVSSDTTASSSSAIPRLPGINALLQQPDKCRGCGKTVYFAEQIMAAGSKCDSDCSYLCVLDCLLELTVRL